MHKYLYVGMCPNTFWPLFHKRYKRLKQQKIDIKDMKNNFLVEKKM